MGLPGEGVEPPGVDAAPPAGGAELTRGVLPGDEARGPDDAFKEGTRPAAATYAEIGQWVRA